MTVPPIKDNITVTSSNSSQNNGTIRILTHFWPKAIGNYQKKAKISYSRVAFMTLYLTCAFEVIKLPNERVIALFHYFFLQFLHIVEIGQKAHNTTISRPLVSCILQTLTTSNLCSGSPSGGLSVNNKQKVRQAMVKISRGGRGGGGGGWQPL